LFPHGYSAFSVVEALAREPGLHRVPVIDSSRRIVNLVTNSQVLKFLSDNIDVLGPILIKPLEGCGNRFLKPVSVTHSKQTAGRKRGQQGSHRHATTRLSPTALTRSVFFLPLPGSLSSPALCLHSQPDRGRGDGRDRRLPADGDEERGRTRHLQQGGTTAR